MECGSCPSVASTAFVTSIYLLIVFGIYKLVERYLERGKPKVAPPAQSALVGMPPLGDMLGQLMGALNQNATHPQPPPAARKPVSRPRAIPKSPSNTPQRTKGDRRAPVEFGVGEEDEPSVEEVTEEVPSLVPDPPDI